MSKLRPLHGASFHYFLINGYISNDTHRDRMRQRCSVLENGFSVFELNWYVYFSNKNNLHFLFAQTIYSRILVSFLNN